MAVSSRTASRSCVPIFGNLHLRDEKARSFLQAVEWPAFDSPSVSIFVISFSELGDLLSQWRSYCPPNRGVSLGFEPDELKRAAAQQSFELVQCTYDLAAQQNSVAAMASRWLAEYTASNSDASQAVVVSKFAVAFAGMAASFKHPSFTEEREWRLVAIAEDDALQPQYREGLSTLVPYITFKVPRDSKSRLRIRRIVVGPTPHAYLARSAITTLVKKNAVLYGQVSESQTPFRAW